MEKASKIKNKFSLFNAIVCAILVVYSITILFSIYFVLVSAVKTDNGFDKNVFGLPLNGTFTFKNITDILDRRLRVNQNGNSLFIYIFPEVLTYTLLYTLGSSFMAAVVPCVTAYFAAKYNYKFSGLLVATVVAVMIIPIVGNIPATMKLLDTLHLNGKIYSLWIMKGNFVNMWFLVFYAAFKSVPNDYMEAAYIDGASELMVMVRVMMPLVKTTFLTIILIFFVDLWNDYQTPLLFTPGYPTLAKVVFDYSQANGVPANFATAPYKMAACALMVVPTIVIFIVFRDKLMGNLTMGGIKG